MKIEKMQPKKQILDNQYKNIQWVEGSGLDKAQLIDEVFALTEAGKDQPKGVLKAKALELVARKARLAIDKEDIFQEKFDTWGVVARQRDVWVKEYYATEGADDQALMKITGEAKAYCAGHDFGHLSTNLRMVMNLGLDGVLKHLEKAKAAHKTLAGEQKAFYESCGIVIKALSIFINRLADAIRPYNEDNYKCLRHIAADKPANIYEAMQFMLIYFNVHENIFGSRIRTLGRLDELLYPFYVNDLKEGTFTEEEIREITKYFLNKLWVMNVAYGLPFELGGLSSSGKEITNDMSYLVAEVYGELDIYSPKIHIRVSDQTPKEFVMLVLSLIRAGKSSFVFANDNIIIKALMKVGVLEKDARDYVFIGCYEPAVYGHEIGCTGNGGINGAKMLELVMNRGRDLKTGALIGVDTGEITTYEEFLAAIKAQIRHAAETCMDVVRHVESHYMEMNPEPFVSVFLEEAVEAGVDAFAGGARYNNSSLSFNYIASLVDGIAAVKRLVFEEKRVGYEELVTILKNNWEGQEKLRRIALALPEKYGNNNPVADEIMQDILKYEASLINNKPNGRGGVFKASMISIDKYVANGARTMATPDGRFAGEPLSKNLCPMNGRDRNGITALIESVTKIDFTDYPNGTVLDIMLHPSAVTGEDGLDAMYAVLMTYFKGGGLALHGNVFDASVLKKAQREPEKYASLQVRVCGWNAYFLNLTRAEQDDFIEKAEHVLG